jgi:hypothetical protein
MEQGVKTVEEFREFCRGPLGGDLAGLEKARQSLLRKIAAVGFALFGITALAGVVLATTFHGEAPFVLICFFAPVVISVVLTALVGHFLLKDYRLAYKFTVMRKIIKFIDESLVYDPMGMIPQSIYMMSKLYSTKPERYRGEDRVKGTLGATAMEFCELHTEYATRDKNGTHWHTIFKGLFFMADFNKHFATRTVVLPDVAENLFGRIGQALQGLIKPFGELVKLDDPEFEKHLKVYGDDQIEARYILSPSLMERIVAFRKRTKKDIRLSFVGTKVFVAVPYTKNLFEPQLLRPAVDFDVLCEHLEDVQLATGIVEDLNLNTRIWSKE